MKPLMEVYVVRDERWPDYEPSDFECGFCIKLTAEEAAEWKKVCSEYDKWQKKIHKMIEE